MEIRGRHRGLPYALDRAILLPSERLHRVETEDLIRRAPTEPPVSFSQQQRQPESASADGLSNATTSFRRRRQRASSVALGNSVTGAGAGASAVTGGGTAAGVANPGAGSASGASDARTGAGTGSVAGSAAGTAIATEPKGKGLGGFLQGALSAGPVRASTWKGV